VTHIGNIRPQQGTPSTKKPPAASTNRRTDEPTNRRTDEPTTPSYTPGLGSSLNALVDD
jgi:hypothetical protein